MKKAYIEKRAMFKKMEYFIIDEKMPSLNEYINICRKNKYCAAKFKSYIETLICKYINKYKKNKLLRPVEYKCTIHFTWHENTQKRDVDNIQFGQKFILDAMQKAGIIKNDSRKYVGQTYHTILNDSDKTYVEVEIREVNNDERTEK